MIIRLFDIQNKQICVTEHCFALKFLSDIMKEFPQEYMKIYAYLFYMSCPNPDLNPFFNIEEASKEELILKEVDAEFSTEEDLIIHALKMCKQLYQTPTYRAYLGIKTMLDRLADYMATTDITHGRDGNITALINAAAKFDQIRQSYQKTYSDMMEEQSSVVRGGQNLAYDDR